MCCFYILADKVVTICYLNTSNKNVALLCTSKEGGKLAGEVTRTHVALSRVYLLQQFYVGFILILSVCTFYSQWR